MDSGVLVSLAILSYLFVGDGKIGYRSLAEVRNSDPDKGRE